MTEPSSDEALWLLAEVALALFRYDDEADATLPWDVANKVWRAFGYGTISIARCGNCDYLAPYYEEDRRWIKNLIDRVDPGGVMPVRECPECGALMYAEEDE